MKQLAVVFGLLALNGCQRDATHQASPAATPLAGASADIAPNDPPGEWRRQACDYANTRYSSLDQVNTGNVARLKDAWSFADGIPNGHEAAPLVVVAAAALYKQHCVMCHGGPGTPRATWVDGMNPTPPYIVDASRRFSPAQLDLIIIHGVKMTGMPAWRRAEMAAQTWEVAALLETLPYLDQSAYRRVLAKAADLSK